jgi:hypothetical protein
MEVDWDEIEKQYVELIPGVKLTQAYPLFSDTTFVKPALGEESTTIIASDALGSPSSNNHASTATHSPNSFEVPRLIQKPDVSS